MHATWNAILKADKTDRLTAFGVTMLVGMAVGGVMLAFFPSIEPQAFKWMLGSATVHLFYYAFLLRAYAHGDLSHTYPIARGTGPLLVALVSGRFLDETLHFQDVAGVALLSAGIFTLAMPTRDDDNASRNRLGTIFAVLTGFTIAGYLLCDGMGVRAAGPTLEHKVAYIAWLNVFDGPWLFMFALWRRGAGVWRYVEQHWLRALATGGIATLGYGIAIWAMSRGPMAHVAALRETSVLFGALIGALVLGEPFGRRRVGAAIVIVAGLLLMNGPRIGA